MRSLFVILFLSAFANAFSQQKHYQLCSRTSGGVFLEDGTNVTFWGYGLYTPGGTNKISLPGPLMKFNKNDSCYVHLHNLSPEGHTIHLHGVDADTPNDGAPHTTGMVNTDDSTLYYFKATHPGTYLYHCHVMSVHHVALGMSSMIVIHNFPDTTLLYDGGPGFNKEYSFFGSDFDTDWNLDPVSPGMFNLYQANYFMLNGKSGTQLFLDSTNVISAQAGDSICLRLATIGYTKTRYIFPSQLNAVAYMGDGRELPIPINSDTLDIFPGERYDVILKPLVNYNGYITVSYDDAILDRPLGQNYIGVNMYSYPLNVAAETLPKIALNVYPNPTQDLLYFDLMEKSNATLVLSDLTLINKNSMENL
jgi:FtsP/CotA-like multicopper oxidase with cupredoxin domain